MYKSAIWHAIIAIIMQLIICTGVYIIHGFTIEYGLLTGSIAACSAYLFREVAQHEYKGGGPKVVKWYYGFINHWNKDSILDLLFPLIATVAIWLIYNLIGK